MPRAARVPKPTTTRPRETGSRWRRGAGSTAKTQVGLDGRLARVKDVRRSVTRPPEEQPVRQRHRTVSQSRRVLVNDCDVGRHLFQGAGEGQVQGSPSRHYRRGDVVTGITIIHIPSRPSRRIGVVRKIRVHPMGRHDRVTRVHTRITRPVDRHAGLTLRAHHIQVSRHDGGPTGNSRISKCPAGRIRGSRGQRESVGTRNISKTLAGIGNVLTDVLFVVTGICGSGAILRTADTTLPGGDGGLRCPRPRANPQSPEQARNVRRFPTHLGGMGRNDLIEDAAIDHEIVLRKGHTRRPGGDSGAGTSRCGRSGYGKGGGRRPRGRRGGRRAGRAQGTLGIRAPRNGEDTIRGVTGIERGGSGRIQVDGMGSVQAHTTRAKIDHMGQDGHPTTADRDTLVTTDRHSHVGRVHGHDVLVGGLGVEVGTTREAHTGAIVSGTAIGEIVTGRRRKGLGADRSNVHAGKENGRDEKGQKILADFFSDLNADFFSVVSVVRNTEIQSSHLFKKWSHLDLKAFTTRFFRFQTLSFFHPKKRFNKNRFLKRF